MVLCQVARVPTYSPSSVAEHSVTLALALNRCRTVMIASVCFAECWFLFLHAAAPDY